MKDRNEVIHVTSSTYKPKGSLSRYFVPLLQEIRINSRTSLEIFVVVIQGQIVPVLIIDDHLNGRSRIPIPKKYFDLRVYGAPCLVTVRAVKVRGTKPIEAFIEFIGSEEAAEMNDEIINA